MTRKGKPTGRWRRRLGIFLLLVLVVGLMHLVSGFWDAHHIQYVREEYLSPRLPTELDGYSIAFITDTHTVSEEKLQAVVDVLNGENIDLLLLGGDYSSSVEGLGTEPTLRILSEVKATDGIYGVEGNHDRHDRAFAIMEEHGIRPLDNEGLTLRPGLYLGGVQDLWNRTPDAQAALSGAQEEDFAILLCHNPDYTMTGECNRADLAFSGHTHGGQITFFGVFAPRLHMRPYITAYGQRFMDGWCKGAEDLDVYVSHGLGTFVSVPRIFATPQVVIVTLVSGEAD